MRDWRTYVAAVAAAGLAWLAGLEVVAAVLVGVAAAAATLVLTGIDPMPDPRFSRSKFDRRHGARGEVQDLAWSMVARDGRVTLRLQREVRTVAHTRLARHGLRLGDPADEAAIRALVGAPAFRTLTSTGSPHPRLSEIRHAVEVLDGLGTTRKQRDA